MPFKYASVAGESMDGSEDTLEEQQGQALRRPSTIYTRGMEKFRIVRWPAIFFLLVAILVCELSILHQQPKRLSIGGELNGLVPHFAQEQKIFRADERYASDHKTMASINATKQNWMELMPRGGGFLNIDDYSSHTLPPPMHFDQIKGQGIYAIAVFHELHCLMHMSGYIDKLIVKIRNKNWTLDEGEVGHNDHCFNYLRNALMCCGDTTLEGQSKAKMFEHVAGTDGTGAVHVCRNYDEISAWAERRRVTDEKESL